jgi:hypothetical protein
MSAELSKLNSGLREACDEIKNTGDNITLRLVRRLLLVYINGLRVHNDSAEGNTFIHNQGGISHLKYIYNLIGEDKI